MQPWQLSFQQKNKRINQTLELVFATEGSFGVGSSTAKPQRSAKTFPDILRNVFPISDVKRAKLEISQINFMSHFPLAHQKVAGFNISMQQIAPMQVLNPVQHLQAKHQDRFKGQPSPAGQSQGINILAQLLNDQIGSAIFLESLLDFRKAMEVRLFEFLVGLDLVVDERAFVLRVALEDEGAAIFLFTALDLLVLQIFDCLEDYVLSFDHQLAICYYIQFATLAHGHSNGVKYVVCENWSFGLYLLRSLFTRRNHSALHKISIFDFLVIKQTEMNLNQFLLKPNLLNRKQLSELNKALELQLVRPERHRMSEPRGKVNLVKINKHKLPLDFFPKKEAFSRRQSSNRFTFPAQYSQQFKVQNRSQSQRQHFSPQKTSFFGSQEDLESTEKQRESVANRFMSRKFQTRQEHKRDLFALQPTRKLNTAAKAHKHQMLQLYPYNHDPQIYELLANSSKTQNLRSPIKKGNSTKVCQNGLLQDPQSSVSVEYSLILKQGTTQPISNQMTKTKNKSMQQNMDQSSNITFYNAKSSCFPPINRGLGKQL